MISFRFSVFGRISIFVDRRFKDVRQVEMLRDEAARLEELLEMQTGGPEVTPLKRIRTQVFGSFKLMGLNLCPFPYLFSPDFL